MNNIVPTHWMEVNEPTFASMNKATCSGYGATLEEIADSDPVAAYDLIRWLIMHSTNLKARYTVQTSVGYIDSEQDLDAARGAFLKSIENNFTGGIVIEPAELIIAVLSQQCDFMTRQPVGLPVAQERLVISVEPPVGAN